MKALGKQTQSREDIFISKNKIPRAAITTTEKNELATIFSKDDIEEKSLHKQAPTGTASVAKNIKVFSSRPKRLLLSFLGACSIFCGPCSALSLARSVFSLARSVLSLARSVFCFARSVFNLAALLAPSSTWRVQSSAGHVQPSEGIAHPAVDLDLIFQTNSYSFIIPPTPRAA